MSASGRNILVGCLAAALVAALPARAAYPGDNGRIGFQTDRSGTSRVGVVNVDGAGFRALTDATTNAFSPSWSPDGLRIAFSAEVEGTMVLYVMDFLAGTVTTVAEVPDVDLVLPCWSPDGTRLVFEGADQTTGFSDVWVIGIDGTGLTNLTASPETNDGEPVWAPDGSAIAFASDRDGNLEVYSMDPDGMNPVNLTENDARDGEPDWAPDSSAIVFASDRGGMQAVWTMGADGSDPAMLTDGVDDDGQPAFSPDGTAIAFVRDVGGDAQIFVMNSDGSLPEPLVVASGTDAWPDWQPIVAGDNLPPVADAGPDQDVECASFDGGEFTIDGSLSSDPDSTEEQSDIALFEWFEDYGTDDETFLGTDVSFDFLRELGTYAFTLQVTDSVGQTSLDDLVVMIVDTTPPVISIESVSPETVWPPNHKMRDVQVVVTASDVCGPVDVVLYSVVSDEPDNARAGGDGNTTDDIQGADVGTADFAFKVRAERLGGRSGRTYTATYEATDAVGLTSTADASVFVLHDKRGMSNGNGNGPGHQPNPKRGKAKGHAGDRSRR